MQDTNAVRSTAQMAFTSNLAFLTTDTKPRWQSEA